MANKTTSEKNKPARKTLRPNEYDVRAKTPGWKLLFYLGIVQEFLDDTCPNHDIYGSVWSAIVFAV